MTYEQVKALTDDALWSAYDAAIYAAPTFRHYTASRTQSFTDQLCAFNALPVVRHLHLVERELTYRFGNDMGTERAERQFGC